MTSKKHRPGYFVYELLESGVVVKASGMRFSNRDEAEQSLAKKLNGTLGQRFVILPNK